MKKGFLTLVTILAFVCSLEAQSIWSNSITGTNPNTSDPFIAGQIVGDHLSVSGIGRGPGAVGTNANDRYNANSWNTTDLDLDAYFKFALTPDSQFELDLILLSFHGQRSSTGPNAYSLRSSLDGFTLDIGVGVLTGSSSSVAYSVDLSGFQFQDLTGPIEFRFYAWGATASGGTFSVNDFSFDGVVNSAAVPEPGACGLLMAGLLGLQVCRKRTPGL